MTDHPSARPDLDQQYRDDAHDDHVNHTRTIPTEQHPAYPTRTPAFQPVLLMMEAQLLDFLDHDWPPILALRARTLLVEVRREFGSLT